MASSVVSSSSSSVTVVSSSVFTVVSISLLEGNKGIIWRGAGSFKGNRWLRQVYYSLLVGKQGNNMAGRWWPRVLSWDENQVAG